METKRERIIALHMQEPTLDTVDIAKLLGMTASRVGGLNSKFKIGIPLVSPEKRLKIRQETIAKAHIIQKQNRELKKKTGQKVPRKGTMTYKVVEYVRNNPTADREEVVRATGVDARTLSFIVYRYKLSISGQVANSTPTKSNVEPKTKTTTTKKRVVTPKPVVYVPPAPVDESKFEYHLRETVEGGKYLHSSCQGLTDNAEYAWKGNSNRMHACQNKFDMAKNLVPHRVLPAVSVHSIYKMRA